MPNQLSKKLRQAADVLDELDELLALRRQTNETPEVARQIRHALHEEKKPHWTQTERGKKILAKRSREAWKRRKAAQ